MNELVLHYAVNSLEEHNEQLRTVLKYPINSHLVKKPEKKQQDLHQTETQSLTAQQLESPPQHSHQRKPRKQRQ